MSSNPSLFEPDAVRERFARRAVGEWRYNPLNPAVLAAMQERQRALTALFRELGWLDLSDRRLLEVGCGGGWNLLDLLRLGFRPENLAGIELQEERVETARSHLPGSVQLHAGDALAIADTLPAEHYDIVMQATVFSSLLDDGFQERLAAVMWRRVKPGGGILWYDFTVNNPGNRDVRGVPLKRVRELFPEGRIRARRVTLAPPLARRAVRLHPALYGVLNTVPLLRTHILAWIQK